MTDPAPVAAIVAPRTRRRLAEAGRFAVAAVLAGVVGGAVFLIMIQGAFRKGHTDLEFNHVLGTLVEGTAEERASTDEALGIIGDSAGLTGLYTTLAFGVAIVLVHGLVIAPRVRRHWAIQALPLALLTFLVLGLVFCGVADSQLNTPVGLFGADAGGMTPLVLALCSLGFGLVGARCFSLVASPAWWAPKAEGLETALEGVAELETEPGSLELAEQGREQRRMRT